MSTSLKIVRNHPARLRVRGTPLEQVPEISIQVFEDSDGTVRLDLGRSYERDSLRDHSVVISPKEFILLSEPIPSGPATSRANPEYAPPLWPRVDACGRSRRSNLPCGGCALLRTLRR